MILDQKGEIDFLQCGKYKNLLSHIYWQKFRESTIRTHTKEIDNTKNFFSEKKIPQQCLIT